jgi:hypothetical protein
MALLATGLLVLCRLWLLPLGNSFWLDESVIVSLIRGSLHSAVQEAFSNAQPVLFSVIEWLVRRLSDHEVVLRLPSLLASFGCLLVLYRIGRDAMDHEAGLLFAAIHLSLPQVAEQAANARPYAAALFFEYMSILWLLRGIRSKRRFDGLAWVACAVIAAHLNYLFITALAAGFLFAFVLTWRGEGLPFRDLGLCAIVGLVGLTPAFPQALLIARESRLLAWVPIPAWVDLPSAVLPKFAMAGMVLAGLAHLKREGLNWKRPGEPRLPLLGAFLLAPAFALFTLARFDFPNLFADRYLLPAVAGSVLLFGWLLLGFGPEVRRVSMVSALILAGVSMGHSAGPSIRPDYHSERWREAVRDAHRSGALLVYSGLVEARRLDWLRDPERWNYLTSPVRAYWRDLPPQHAFVLPHEFGPEERRYTQTLLDERLHDYDAVTVFGRNSGSWRSWASWLPERLEAAGFDRRRTAAYGSIQLDVFERARR